VKRIRAATEAEVIAEFLRSEYHQKEYHVDRRKYEQLVMHPNLANELENEIRRELLYRRHRVTWNELPDNTSWFQVALELEDVDKLRIFPRGHWPKLASESSFAIVDIARNLRRHNFAPEVADDVTAIHAIAYRLRHQDDNSSVLLIGLDDLQPLTILEGNHRMIAAALDSKERVMAFNTYAGFSPSMGECFWYQTTFQNMFRHACHRLRDFQPDLFRALIQRWAA